MWYSIIHLFINAMGHKIPNKRTRDVMREHRLSPHVLTQAEVKRKLSITENNSFYRLFYRSTIADYVEDYKNQTEGE